MRCLGGGGGGGGSLKMRPTADEMRSKENQTELCPFRIRFHAKP